MEAGVLVFVLRDAVTYLETSGILSKEGVFRNPSVKEAAEFADVLVDSLEAHGVAVDDDIERTIDAIEGLLPLILTLVRKNDVAPVG